MARLSPLVISLLAATVAYLPLSDSIPLPRPVLRNSRPDTVSRHHALGARVLYVARDGNDTWSGTQPTPQPSGTDGPLASVARAQQLIQQATNGTRGGWTVRIRQGTYSLTALTFTLADSGAPGQPNVYTSFPGDSQPVLSGGYTINPQATPWTPSNTTQGAYEVSTASWPSSIGDFKTLSIDGARAPRAASDIQYWAGILPGGKDAQKWGFQYEKNQMTTYKQLSRVIVTTYHAWTASLSHIRTINSANDTVVFTSPTKWPIGQWATTAGAKRYSVENAIELLDTPGEWYHDIEAKILYMIPPKDVTDLNNVTVTVTSTPTVLHAANASNIVFDNLHFRDTDWTCGENATCDGQSAAFQTSASIHLQSSDAIHFRHCNISVTGDYALWLGDGTHDSVVDSCDFQDLGTGGVRIGNSGANSASRNNIVTNNVITQGGHVVSSGCGVLSQMTYNATITHNEISYLYYSGVSAGWDWQYGDAHASNITIAYNHIHHIGQNLLSDMGGIYTLGEQPYTALTHNLIHDIYSFDYGGWGIYPDQASSYETIAYNVIYDTKSAGFHQHWGKANLVTNNVFASGANCAYQNHCQTDGGIRTDPGSDANSFTFTKNIVYLTNGTLFYGDWTDPPTTVSFNDNVYYNASGDESSLRFPGNIPFAEWKYVKKQDKDSLVTNPLFVNASASNYALQSDSPAIKLGIKSIDLSQVGPQRSSVAVQRRGRQGRVRVKVMNKQQP